MGSLKDRTLFITGASRGIGKAIARRAARDGANIVIAARTVDPQPTLPGTIYTAAEEIERAGGRALPLAVDIRFEEQVRAAMADAAGRFGGIDILVNNAGAISLTDTLGTPMKRFDLLHQVNARGAYLCSQAALPYLQNGRNPHILMLAPPLDLRAEWFAGRVAGAMAKFGMSLCVLGMAREFAPLGVAVNALWPRTMIATSLLQNLPDGEELARRARKPEIMADAAYGILTRDSRACTGCFFVDEEALRAAGVADLSGYAVDPKQELLPDLFTYCARRAVPSAEIE